MIHKQTYARFEKYVQNFENDFLTTSKMFKYTITFLNVITSAY
jgi:hypothetical protein